MMFFDSVEVNLINCERVNCKAAKKIFSMLMNYKEHLAKIKLNLVYSEISIEECMSDLLQELGFDSALLKVLEDLKIKSKIVFSNNAFTADMISTKVYGWHCQYNFLKEADIKFLYRQVADISQVKGD